MNDGTCPLPRLEYLIYWPLPQTSIRSFDFASTVNIANMLSYTFAGLVAAVAFARGAIAQCNRTALLEFADAYVVAHENG